METTTAAPRYMATDLVSAIKRQGRRSDWVARQAGLHPSALSHIASRRRSVDAERAEAIAMALDVTIADIFTPASSDAV